MTELDALIAAEKRSDGRLQRARAEAEAMVALARREAGERDAALQDAIEQQFRERQQALRTEHDQQVAAARQEADAAVARFDAVSPEAIAAVVPALLDHLLAPGARP